MPRGRTWSEEDEEYLHEMWGTIPTVNLAKKLNRTLIAVELKAKKLNLGAAADASEYLTATMAADILKVTAHTVINWIAKYGLKANKRIIRKCKKMIMIKHDDLLSWLEANKDKWDSRKVELYALGQEPTWLKEKRKLDASLPIRGNCRWTKAEDQRAIMMFKSGLYTNGQIGNALGRSAQSVERRIDRLNIWAPKQVPTNNQYKGCGI